MVSETGGGNYGYKLKAGYGYTADPLDIFQCGSGYSDEQLLQNNLVDNTANNYICDSLPRCIIDSYTEQEK